LETVSPDSEESEEDSFAKAIEKYSPGLAKAYTSVSGAIKSAEDLGVELGQNLMKVTTDMFRLTDLMDGNGIIGYKLPDASEIIDAAINPIKDLAGTALNVANDIGEAVTSAVRIGGDIISGFLDEGKNVINSIGEAVTSAVKIDGNITSALKGAFTNAGGDVAQKDGEKTLINEFEMQFQQVEEKVEEDDDDDDVYIHPIYNSKFEQAKIDAKKDYKEYINSLDYLTDEEKKALIKKVNTRIDNM